MLSLPPALALDKEAAEDFARGRLRNLRDELDAANFLVRRDVRGHVAQDLAFGQSVSVFDDDEGLRDFARLLVGAWDDRGIGDRRGDRKSTRLNSSHVA